MARYKSEKLYRRPPKPDSTQPQKGRSAFKTELSINDIRASAWNVTQGNEVSLKKLQAENRKLAKIANRRLKALEEAEMDMFAYDRAITYLKNNDRSRFPTQLISTSDFSSIVKQMSELVTFINASTSTVAGAKAAMNKKLDTLSEFTGTKYTDEQRKRLGRLLGTDSVSTLLREVRGDSAEVIDVLEEISMDEVNTEEIMSIIDKHLVGYVPWESAPWEINNSNMSYDTMMDELRAIVERKRGE